MAPEDAGPAEAADPDQPPPEATGAAERRYPSTLGGALYLLVLLATGVGIAIPVITGDWRLGVKILSAALATAAGLRLVLPRKDAGMLAVRHRLIDVGLLGSVAVALWVLATTIPNQPGL